ncbi:MAG: hypothetical protein HYV06_00415 [Deltaproteobacteria bacterium]|nr:hypothetical protein [Deltaproteobacteria bacterium]
MRKALHTVVAIAMFALLAPFHAGAAVMNDYCVTPPFIQESILPNLLMIIDNSASMFDLAYADTGRKRCSTTTATYCTADAGCPSGESCVFTNGRQPYYCYDQTYDSTKTYVGYFVSSQLYKYVGDYTYETMGEFQEDSTAYSCSPGSGETAKSISGQLCVIYSAANKATVFKATGNYLNWLTASKFDVQKGILTGGKYNGTHLLAESRGCVGNSFIKEANTANFVNYNSPETNNTNTSLGITFGVRGLYDPVNKSAPSPGGQTYLDIYKGNYDQGKCQAAVNAIVSGGNAEIKQTVEDCLASTSGTTAVTKTKVVFQQSMQACWQKREGHAIGGDDINTVKNQCPDIYDEYATCSSNPDKVCTEATKATDCAAGDSCIDGPPAIVPGNAALLCSSEYEGQYYYKQAAAAAGTCLYNGAACTSDSDCSPATFMQCKKTDNACTTDADCPGSGNSCFKTITNSCSISAVTAGWTLIPGVTDAQMIATHNQFCNDMTATPVIDPTDAPSDTSQYDNVPAILSGTGVEGQLNQPIGTMTVRLKRATAPSGVISEFGKRVRIGVMTFNFAGSAAEATAGTLPAPKVCSNDSTKVCSINIDCVSPGTCDATTAGTSNLDGAKIEHYIGTGHCSATTATVCYNDANCPSGETCKTDGVGDYSTGLVKVVNDIPARSWTPFAEALYNAIGYFAKVPATGKSRTDLRINSADFNENRNPSQYRCQTNSILLISDGMSTADRNTSVDNLAKLYTAAGGSTSWTETCPSYAGSRNLDNMAWIAYNRNINTFDKAAASTTAPAEFNERIKTYVVFNGDSNGQAGECDSKTLLSQTAINGGTTTLYQAVDPGTQGSVVRGVLEEIAGGAASGTAASILSNSEGSGATLLQALFYPKKEFDKINDSDADPTSVNWIGELQSYWYYLDPFLQNTSIREDTAKDYKLNLINDKVIQFYFDPEQKKTLVNKYSDLNGDGVADSSTPDEGGAALSPDVVKSLWKAGRMLWERNLATDPRTIYTGYASSSSSTPRKFSKLEVDGYLNTWPNFQRVAQTSHCSVTLTTSCSADADCPSGETCVLDNTKTAKLIDYVHGIDQVDHTDGTTYRDRRVTITGCGVSTNSVKGCSSKPAKACGVDADCAAGEGTCITLSNNAVNLCTREWKLGDIISSTPKLVSNLRINNYNQPPPIGYGDTSYTTFTETTSYKNRGMAFVGANDGMLHAFKLGILKELKGKIEKAQLNDAAGNLADDADKLGREEWAFIPSDAVPFLKYHHDPAYSHLYYVDRNPVIFDASIGVPTGCSTDYSACTKTDGSTWRTILIGGMGIGGAAKSFGAASGVKVPQNTAYGYSQYFALDVTDPAAPKYLWEIYGGNLGYATTGPAIIRIAKKDASGKPDHTKNGKWYAVFASGPTGPIDTDLHQFKGESDQNLRLFVVDIKTGTVVRTIDTGIANAFAGTLTSSWIDADRSNSNSNGYYSDDAVYIGYVQKDTSVTPATWTKGGVLRLLTREHDDPADADVNKQWKLSTVISSTGPVTTSITKLQDRKNHNLWLYFGTGRFFYKNDDPSTTRQTIYGVKEPCYSTATRTMQDVVAGGSLDDIDHNCTDAVSGTIVDQSAESAAPAATLAATAPGWKIQLDAKDDANAYLTERIITDPLAAPNGAVFFTSFKPSSDLCKFGGSTMLWAVRYDTGATPPASAMQGKALIQVSTGAFSEVKLSEAFKNPGSTRYDGRRLASPITGVPPTAQGLSLFSNPPPAKRLLHVREK